MTLTRKKEIGILVVAVLLTALFLMLFQLITRQNLWLVATWIEVLVVVIIWSSLYLTCAMFVTNRSGSSIILAVIPPVVVMAVGKFSLIGIGAAIIMFLFLLLIQRNVHWELNSRLKIKYFPAFKGSTRQLLLSLVIVCTALSMPSIQHAIETNKIEVPTQFLTVVLKPLDSVFKVFIPGYKNTATVDDIIATQVEDQKKKLPSTFTIPSELQLSANQQEVLRKQFGRQFNLVLNGHETMVDIISILLNRYISQAVSANTPASVTVAAITLIFSFLLIVPFLAWPVLMLLQLWIFIATRIGLIVIVKTQVEAERFTL